MSKLCGYELKRLIFNKFFLGLFLITIIYGWQLLGGDIILGVAYTAPFSEWSYGTFLSSIAPLLFITLLFFITYLYSKNEKAVRVLTTATPISPIQYGLVKCFAIFIGFFIIVTATILTSFIFYANTFKFYHFTQFIFPFVLTIIPAMLFIMGVGMIAGQIHISIIYTFMVLLLLLQNISLPYFFDLFGHSFFQSYPLTLPIGSSGEPAFFVPSSVIIGKLIFSLIGIIFITISLFRYKKKEAV